MKQLQINASYVYGKLKLLESCLVINVTLFLILEAEGIIFS